MAPTTRSRHRPTPRRLAAALLALLGASAARAQLTGLGSDQLDDGSGTTSEAEQDDRFGSRLAAGFFDDDPYEDLAVGVPDEDIGSLSNTGAVHVFYGSPGGPSLTGDQGFTVGNTIGAAKADDRFGHALAAGDLDGDGIDDLVIGVPGRDTAGQNSAGAVVVLRGTANGLAYVPSFCGLLHQNRTNDSSGVGGADNAAAAGESFGEAVAILPAVATGVPWIAIGVPGENVAGVDDSGMVELVLTRAAGASGCLETAGAATTFVLHQAGPLCESCGAHYEGQLEVDDHFGQRLAVGDFDDDGRRDLAVGVPLEDVGSATDCGVAQVFYATTNGTFPTANDEVWSQDSSGVQGACEGYEKFGNALAAGDFDATAGDDLAIGAPEEDLNEASPDPQERIYNAGVLHVLYSAGSGGLSAEGDVIYVGPEQEHANYGEVLLAAELIGSNARDLVLGFPHYDPFFNDDQGAAWLYHGSVGSDFGAYTPFSQATTDVPDVPEDNDQFGGALATGDFDGNGTADLAIGVPGEDLAASNAGAVTILYARIPSKDAFGSAQYTASGIAVAESVGTRTVTIRRTGGAPVGATVSYDNSGGTATEGEDHGAVGGSRSWAEGEIGDKTFTVAINNDTVDEANETIRIPLSSPTAGLALGSPDVFVLTIMDDDSGGVLRFLGESFGFSESIGTRTITVSRSNGVASGVTVHYASSAGTATAGVDYTGVSGNLSFGAGETSESFQLEIVDDDVQEADETLSLSLSNPTGGAILGTPSSVPITILDDDGPGSFRFAGGTVQANESAADVQVVVERLGGSTGAATVDVATVTGGSATAGDDFTAGSATLVFADGETSQSFAVALLDDELDEGNETIRLELSNPTGGAGLTFPDEKTVTILDDDGGPVLLFDDDFEAGDACGWSDAEGLEPACLP